MEAQADDPAEVSLTDGELLVIQSFDLDLTASLEALTSQDFLDRLITLVSRFRFTFRAYLVENARRGGATCEEPRLCDLSVNHSHHPDSGRYMVLFPEGREFKLLVRLIYTLVADKGLRLRDAHLATVCRRGSIRFVEFLLGLGAGATATAECLDAVLALYRESSHQAYDEIDRVRRSGELLESPESAGLGFRKYLEHLHEIVKLLLARGAPVVHRHLEMACQCCDGATIRLLLDRATPCDLCFDTLLRNRTLLDGAGTVTVFDHSHLTLQTFERIFDGWCALDNEHENCDPRCATCEEVDIIRRNLLTFARQFPFEEKWYQKFIASILEITVDDTAQARSMKLGPFLDVE